MKTLTIVVALFLSCGPAQTFDAGLQPVQLESAALLEQTLADLPVCGPAAHPEALRVERYICTRKHCQQACCNTCNWRFYSGTPGVLTTDPTNVLQLPEGAKDCEVLAWDALLAGRTVDLAAGCVGAP